MSKYLNMLYNHNGIKEKSKPKSDLNDISAHDKGEKNNNSKDLEGKR